MLLASFGFFPIIIVIDIVIISFLMGPVETSECLPTLLSLAWKHSFGSWSAASFDDSLVLPKSVLLCLLWLLLPHLPHLLPTSGDLINISRTETENFEEPIYYCCCCCYYFVICTQYTVMDQATKTWALWRSKTFIIIAIL